MERRLYLKESRARGIRLFLACIIAFALVTLSQAAVFADEVTTVGSFLSEVSDVAEVETPEKYPLSVSEYDGENWLKFYTNSTSMSESKLTLKMNKAATISFDYQLDTAEGSGLRVKVEGEVYYIFYNLYGRDDLVPQTGTMSGTASVDAEAGETIEISFCRGYTDADGQGDCMYIKNLKASLPNQVIFHANNETDETKNQGIFTTSNLEKNTFTYVKHRFLGWATSKSNADAGSVEYNDGDSFTIKRDTDLYAVWEEVCGLTFDVKPNDADFTLYSDAKHSNVVSAIKDYYYEVDQGDYYWVCEKFGFQRQTGKVTVADTDNSETIALVENPKYTVSFVFGSESDSIRKQEFVLKTGDRTMEGTASSNTITYELPVGYSYEYSFHSANYHSEKGSIDLTDKTKADTQTITIPLDTKDVWEGSADIDEPEVVDGVYQIETGANLAWLAQVVNSGEGVSYNAILTENINLGGLEWTPIGINTSGKRYAGTFDGNGKTVTGLSINATSQNQGLFGCVDSGIIKDVTVEGTVKGSGTSSNAGVGGVVGTLFSISDGTGTVTGCINKATVSGEGNVGGVVGCSSTSNISNCANLGDIKANNNAGGIAGAVYGESSVTNCYNRGNISAEESNAAGIVAYINVYRDYCEVYNCYTSGSYTSAKNANATVGEVESQKYGTTTLKKLYYLESDDIEDPYGIAKTEEELKALADTLNTNADATIWKKSIAAYNDGYPVFVTETVPVDTSALDAAITEMEAYLETLTEDSQAEQKDTLTKALEEAKAVRESSELTQDSVDKAVSTLAESKEAAIAEQSVADRIAEALKGAYEESTAKIKELEEKISALQGDLDFQKKSVTSLKAKASKKKVTLTWTKVSGATGYKVYRATKKNGKYKLVKTIKTNQGKYISGKMKKGRYFYKVRAYNADKMYSKYSAVKKVKVK